MLAAVCNHLQIHLLKLALKMKKINCKKLNYQLPDLPTRLGCGILKDYRNIFNAGSMGTLHP